MYSKCRCSVLANPVAILLTCLVLMWISYRFLELFPDELEPSKVNFFQSWLINCMPSVSVVTTKDNDIVSAMDSILDKDKSHVRKHVHVSPNPTDR